MVLVKYLYKSLKSIQINVYQAYVSWDHQLCPLKAHKFEIEPVSALQRVGQAGRGVQPGPGRLQGRPRDGPSDGRLPRPRVREDRDDDLWRGRRRREAGGGQAGGDGAAAAVLGGRRPGRRAVRRAGRPGGRVQDRRIPLLNIFFLIFAPRSFKLFMLHSKRPEKSISS